MNTVLGLIYLLAWNNLENGIAYQLSNYIIKHLYYISDMSMQELAKQCFVSTSSISKYCRLLGFSSYTEFKWHLSSTIQSRKIQLIEKQKNINTDILIKKIENITDQKIDKEKLLKKIEECADMIYREEALYIYGAVFPLMLTQCFCEDMAIMNKPVFVRHISYGPLEISSKGTLMIISISGRFQETHQAEYAKMCQLNKNNILLSQDQLHLDNVGLYFSLPETISSEFDDLVLLLLLDMIKHCYYQKYYQS